MSNSASHTTFPAQDPLSAEFAAASRDSRTPGWTVSQPGTLVSCAPGSLIQSTSALDPSEVVVSASPSGWSQSAASGQALPAGTTTSSPTGQAVSDTFPSHVTGSAGTTIGSGGPLAVVGAAAAANPAVATNVSKTDAASQLARRPTPLRLIVWVPHPCRRADPSHAGAPMRRVKGNRGAEVLPTRERRMRTATRRDGPRGRGKAVGRAPGPGVVRAPTTRGMRSYLAEITTPSISTFLPLVETVIDSVPDVTAENV